MQASRRGGRLPTQHLHRCESLGQGFRDLGLTSFTPAPRQDTFLYQAVYIYSLKATDIRPADQSLFDRRDVLVIHTVPCVLCNSPARHV